MITGMLMKEDIEKARKLKSIELDEISFVKNPANRRAFLFAKSENGDDDVLEEFLDIIDVVCKSADLSEEEDASIESAMKILEKVSTEDRPDLVKAIMLLSRVVGASQSSSVPVVKGDIDGDEKEELWPSLAVAAVINQTFAEGSL
jgi:CBS domain-containing protein